MRLSDRFPLATNPQIGQVRRLVQGQKDVVDLGYGEVNFDTPAHIREAAKKALDEGFTHYALPTEGIKELKAAMAEKLLKDNGIAADPETEVLVTVGGQLGINLVMQSVLNPGDEVIATDPCFMAYPTAVRFAGGTLRGVPVREDRDFRVDPEDIRKSVTDRTKLIVLVYPDNPTGSCLTREDLEAIGRIARERDLLVLCDEIYERYMWDGRKHVSMASLPGMKERTITVNGFSKAFAMTGWRIGYVVAAAGPVMDNLKALHALYVLTITSFAQKGAVAALTGLRKPVDDMVKDYAERIDMMVSGLNEVPGVTCRKPWGSFYVYPSIKGTGMTSLDFAKRMAAETKVLLYPGTAFGPGGEGYLRISVSISKAEIAEAVRRLRAVAVRR